MANLAPRAIFVLDVNFRGQLDEDVLKPCYREISEEGTKDKEQDNEGNEEEDEETEKDEEEKEKEDVEKEEEYDENGVHEEDSCTNGDHTKPLCKMELTAELSGDDEDTWVTICTVQLTMYHKAILASPKSCTMYAEAAAPIHRWLSTTCT